MNRFYLLVSAVFTTAAVNAQFIDEDFSSATGATPPAGWTSTDISASGVNWVFNNPSDYPVDDPMSGNVAVLDSDFFSDGESPEDAVLTSPVINASVLTGNLILSFDHWFIPDAVGEWAVEVYDGVTWTEVLSGNTFMEQSQGEYIDITTAAGGSANAQVRFHWTGMFDFFWMVDNVLVVDETCPPVATLGVSAITSGSALAAWEPGGTETNWNLVYGPAGFDPEDATVIDVDTDPQYAISGLGTGMTYEFYVQADCGAGDESIWMGPYQFTTICAPAPINTLPWMETFEFSAIPGLPCGWLAEDSNSDLYEWITQEDPDENSVVSLSWNEDAETPSNDWLFTPELVLQAGVDYQLTFDEIMGFGDYEESMSIMIGSDQTSASMSTLLLNLEGVTTADYTYHIVDFTVPADGSYHIGFHGYSDPDMLSVILDNIRVRETPTCLEVLNVEVGDITGGSAALSWTAGGSETNWIVEIGETGFTPGTGDLVNVSGTPSTILTGLDGETTYDVYVTTDCGGGDLAEAAGPETFTTFCVLPAISAYPWTENFDAVTYGEMPCGWLQNDANNDGIVWAAINDVVATGQALAILYNMDEPMNDWAMTPGFVMTAGQTYTLGFDYGSLDNTYIESFTVYSGTSQTVGAMTNEIGDYQNVINTTLMTEEISFTPSSSGTYYFGFHGNSVADQLYLILDNVSVEEAGLGLEESALSLATLYPNPSNGKVMVNLSGEAENVFYTVTDITGKIVIGELPVNGTQTTIDLSKETDGVYFINLSSDSARKTYRIVLTK